LGHTVVLHARNPHRANDAIEKNPKAENVLVADLSDLGQCKNLSDQVNESGTFDVVIHNAGLYQASSKEMLFVNVLAPYILTSLIQKPKRIIYLSSGMHLHGHFNIDHFKMNSRITYSDSKLYDVMLSMAVA